MYRTPTGHIAFSFTHFMNNAAPSIMRDSTADPDPLPPSIRDIVFTYQKRQTPNPEALSPLIFHIANLIDNEKVSIKVFDRLVKAGVLNGKETPGVVDTRQIGPKFTHQLAIVDVHTQKKIVDMLFWWEGEMARLDALEEEKHRLEGEIERLKMKGVDLGLEELTASLGKVVEEESKVPSQRVGGVEMEMPVTEGNEDLPAYQA